MFLGRTIDQATKVATKRRKSIQRPSNIRRVSFFVTEASPLIDESESELSLEESRSLSADYQPYEHSLDALRLCGFLFLTYLVMAIVAFSFVFERWPILYSAYFSVVTFTTIGFGDLTPSNTASKMFTVCFTLFGVAILGLFLGIIGNDIFEAQKEAQKEAKTMAKKRILHMFSGGESDTSSHHPPPGHVFDDSDTRKVSVWQELREIVVLEAPLVAAILLVTILIGRFEGWSIVDSIYYCVISLTTVGYGDVHPDTKAAMLINIFFLPLAVAIFGEILARIAGCYISRMIQQKEGEFLNRELTLSDLKAMDQNLDDKVELWEFLSFMLVAMQKVDKASIEELKTLFYSLDANGTGFLEKGDLIIAAKRKKHRILGTSSSRSLQGRSHTHI